MNPLGTVAILRKSFNNRTSLNSYEFKIVNNKSNAIPILHLDMPKGYSVFCDEWEYKEIIKYVAKKSKEKSNQKQKTESIEAEPVPRGKHNHCQLCNIKFDNYLEHIKSKMHLCNLEKNKQIFNNIKKIFKRVVEDKKKENLINNTNIIIYSCIHGKNTIIPDKEIFDKNLKTILSSDVTTKEDSILYESNNNIIKKNNNLPKIYEWVEQKEKCEENCTNDLDEIKKLLEIFSETDKKNKKNNQRKKNEINDNYEKNNKKSKFFGIDPYIKLKKVTRMIAQCNLQKNERKDEKGRENDEIVKNEN